MKYIILIVIMVLLLLLVLFLNIYQTKLVHDTDKAPKKNDKFDDEDISETEFTLSK